MRKSAFRMLAVGVATVALAGGWWAPAPPACAQEAAPSDPEIAAEEAEASERDPTEVRVVGLIAEAASLAAGAKASAAELNELDRLMRELQEGLERKAELLEGAQPTEEVEASLEAAAQELETLLSSVAERAATAEAEAEAVPEVADERPKQPDDVAAFGGVLAGAAEVLERIKELRAELAPPPPTRPRPAGLVRGRVVDGRTGRPVAGASLRVAGRKVVADVAGVFRMAGLRTGSHRLVVRARGFLESERVVTVADARDVVLTLALTPVPSRSRAPLRVRR